MGNKSPDYNAASRVYSVPELLEAIILLLPVQQLLTTVNVVDRQWHDTLKGSLKLQQLLFFQPLREELAAPVNDDTPDEEKCSGLRENPILHACGWWRVTQWKGNHFKHMLQMNPCVHAEISTRTFPTATVSVGFLP